MTTRGRTYRLRPNLESREARLESNLREGETGNWTPPEGVCQIKVTGRFPIYISHSTNARNFAFLLEPILCSCGDFGTLAGQRCGGSRESQRV